jgi:hypothetical protein
MALRPERLVWLFLLLFSFPSQRHLPRKCVCGKENLAWPSSPRVTFDVGDGGVILLIHPLVLLCFSFFLFLSPPLKTPAHAG